MFRFVLNKCSYSVSTWYIMSRKSLDNPFNYESNNFKPVKRSPKLNSFTTDAKQSRSSPLNPYNMSNPSNPFKFYAQSQSSPQSSPKLSSTSTAVDIPCQRDKFSNRHIFSSQPELITDSSGKKHIVRSWHGSYEDDFEKNSYSGNYGNHKSCPNSVEPESYITYNAMANSKGSGVIPYTITSDGVLLFLLQEADNPLRKKDAGWNDFGGKKDEEDNEDTISTACREFSEETSCLFYLKENEGTTTINPKHYGMLIDTKQLSYSDESVEVLRKLIPQSQKFYEEKIKEVILPMYISSKEIYISYFIKVPFIPATDIPRAEDLHIHYEDRYTRKCRWFTYDEIMDTPEYSFHKRLQITKVKQRIQNYYERNMFQ